VISTKLAKRFYFEKHFETILLKIYKQPIPMEMRHHGVKLRFTAKARYLR